MLGSEFRISCDVAGERWPVGFGARPVLAPQLSCGFPCLFRSGVSPSLKKSSPPLGPGISFARRCFFTGSVSVIVTGLSWGLNVHVTISVGCVFKESSISSGGKLL